jgi:hypothetical protein
VQYDGDERGVRIRPPIEVAPDGNRARAGEASINAAAIAADVMLGGAGLSGKRPGVRGERMPWMESKPGDTSPRASSDSLMKSWSSGKAGPSLIAAEGKPEINPDVASALKSSGCMAKNRLLEILKSSPESSKHGPCKY